MRAPSSSAISTALARVPWSVMLICACSLIVLPVTVIPMEPSPSHNPLSQAMSVSWIMGKVYRL